MTLKEEIIETARAKIARTGFKGKIPLDQKKWAPYLKNLRKNILEMNQEDFWGMVGIKVTTGCKYERINDGTEIAENQCRLLPKEKMFQLSDLLDLPWETRKTYLLQNDLDGTATMTKAGLRMLAIIEDYGFTERDMDMLAGIRDSIVKLGGYIDSHANTNQKGLTKVRRKLIVPKDKN